MPTGGSAAREVHVGAVAERVTEEDLRDIVGRSKSWRGVLRAVSLTGTGRRQDLAGEGRRVGHRPQPLRPPARRSRRAPRGCGDEPVLARGPRPARVRGGQRIGASEHPPAVRGAAGPVRLPRRRRPGRDAVQPTLGPRRLREAGSYLVAAACALRGYSVSWPLEPVTYDLVVDLRPHGLQRVQVKTATSKTAGSWVAWITRGDPHPVQPRGGRLVRRRGRRPRRAHDPHRRGRRAVVGPSPAHVRCRLDGGAVSG